MPIKVNAVEFREKHARNLKASVPDIRRGIERVTESPMEKAVAQKDKMRANLMAALDDGKWERGLGRVSLAEWKTKFLNKGVAAIAAGVDASSSKIEKFAGELLSHEASLQAEVDRMPNQTLEDSIGRMTAWTRGMATFKRS